MSQQNPDRYLTYEQVSEITTYSTQHLCRLVGEGELPALRLSRKKTLFREADVHDWIRKRAAERAAK